jgi:Animal haem peroxidase/LysM domain
MRELTGIAIVRIRPGRASAPDFRGVAMPRIAHGENVTPDQVEEAERELTDGGGAALAAAAAGPGDRAFGFMFSDLQKDEANLLPQSTKSPTTPTLLKRLGRTMIDTGSGPGGDSDIPAIYTYFGQFVDHDITLAGSPFAPVNLFNSKMPPLPLAKIRSLKNLRRPTLDLDSVYGPTSPPDSNPPHQQQHPAMMRIGNVTRFPGLRGRGNFPVRLKSDDNDLPRKPQSPDKRQDRAALIGDPRNDENLIVAQLHLAFLKAHNALVAQGKSFDEARRLLRQHYQWIVIHDFLMKRVADPDIVEGILHNGNRVYDPPAGQFFLPLEFTVAAYRFGHSMVRNVYDFNLNFNAKTGILQADLSLLFGFTAFSGQLAISGQPGGTPTLPDTWIIEWHRFVDTLDPKASNKARKINTKLAGISEGQVGLFGLQDIEGKILRGDRGRLAVRNLLRGYRLRMPTGQAVARRLGLRVLTPGQIKEAAASRQQVDALAEGGFLERTPLWYYLLAEAAHPSGGNGQRLGPVGSTIVAEVLIGLIRRSEDSILRTPGWRPSLLAANDGEFELADLLRFAGALPQTYEVQQDDSLSTIARDQLGDVRRWPEIFVLNRDDIAHRDVIHEGQVLLLPGNTPRGLRPVLHTFRTGETIAGLAEKFLGDRERGPEIRELNGDMLGAHNPAHGDQLVILPP